MVQLVVGQKGKGKTTEILGRANEEIRNATGSIVFLDKDRQHMYELNNKIRLIDISAFPITNCDEFVGFVCGIFSQDHDLQTMYIDGFMKCAKLVGKDVTDTILKLDKASTMFNVNVVISLALDREELPEAIQDKIFISL